MPSTDFLLRSRQQPLGPRPQSCSSPCAATRRWPAIAAAIVFARQRDPNALILALAADHAVFDLDLFLESCRAARDAAEAKYIVACGIRPSEPRTSYGYIAAGSPIGNTPAREVKAFVEKPDLATAARYMGE